MRCPHCNEPVPRGRTFCRNCGSQVATKVAQVSDRAVETILAEDGTLRCGACQTRVRSGNQYCVYCGTRLQVKMQPATERLKLGGLAGLIFAATIGTAMFFAYRWNNDALADRVVDSPPINTVASGPPPVTVEPVVPSRDQFPPPRKPASGTIVWSGVLRQDDFVVVVGNQATRGTVNARLPRRPLDISVEGAQLVQGPRFADGWQRYVFKGNRSVVTRVTITWVERQSGR
jgi:hypothetical protein